MRRFRPLAPLIGTVTAAALFVAACPPHEWAPAAWLVPGLLLVSVRRLRPRNAALAGVLFGMLIGLGITSWAPHAVLAYFGANRPAAWAFALLVWFVYAGVPCGVLTLMYRVSARRLPAPARAAAAAWIWAASEWLRATLFTGMPWELLGHSQFRQVALIQIAELGGVYSVSFVMALTSVAVAELIADRAWGGRWRELEPVRRLIPAAALLAAVLAFGVATTRWSRPITGGMARTVAIVQGNIPNEFRWQRAYFERAVGTYVELTTPLATQRPDLIVWPENAVSFYLDREPAMRARLGAVARMAHAELLVGAPRSASGNRVHNSAYVIAPGGRIAAVYDKRRLVPFAEYNPLPWLADDPEEIAYIPGVDDAPITTGAGRVGAVICYEVLFPGLVRSLVQGGAEILINIANDAWMDHGNGAAPRQHLSMAIFRAVETRRYLVRASASGVSAFVNPYGAVYSTVEAGRAGVASAPVGIAHVHTLYVRWGDTWILVGNLMLAVGLAYNALASRIRAAARPSTAGASIRASCAGHV